MLIIHQCIHTGERPHACLRHGKIFRQKSGLNKRQRVHRVDVAPQCAQCGRDIGKTQGVPIHQAPYRCPECSIDLSLRIHLRDMIHRYSDSRRGFGKEPKPIRPQERHAAERPFTGTESYVGKTYVTQRYEYSTPLSNISYADINARVHGAMSVGELLLPT
ncbi:hypothetical protein UY3_16235 [Chelonia mydas]|uniref:C2H2-type domain-containing protein n=1 Tax=Chelonia mydas TaxID=8469 RepID=M7BEN5_CHEMY|nr:hypothetical protein UY3_16235 [Chelonia mydas]